MRLSVPTPRDTVICLGLLSALALGMALVSQYAFGYAPCDLCLIQRYWHAAVVAAAMLALLARRPRLWLAVQSAALTGGFGYALFHVGVERHWWHGSEACVGQTGASSLQDLTREILNAPVVRCDEVRLSLFGLSMAAYNAALSLIMAIFALYTLGRKR